MISFRRRRRSTSKRSKPPKTINSAQQDFTFTRRAMFVGGVQGVLGLALAARMTYISVAENERYKLLSESNRVNLTLLPPRRGWFIDRYGKPIADNRADFRVDIIPERLANREGTVRELATLLNLSGEEVTRINKELDEKSGFQPVQVASGLDWERYAAVSVRLPDMPGVSPRQGFSRRYPAGAAVGHLIGYVGTASKEEYDESKDPLLITPGFKIGKDGLESAFEQDLKGKPGAKRVEVTASGKIVQELTTRSDVPGKPVQLALDVDLHHYAARRLGQESGSVVVIDCETGGILTMASMPSFDPNSFSDGIGVSEYKWLQADDHVPLRNKALKGLYPPGSTVKPSHAMAFMENGIDPDESIICGGGRRIGNRFFHCWGNHGVVDMAKGIYQSCDSYFYHFAQKVGFEKVANFVDQLGMGQEFPLPVTSQFYGTVPSPSWKEKKFGKPWQTYDTVNASIGQGYYLANPLQLAVMCARLATGKKLMPHLVMDQQAPPPESLGFPEDHIVRVRNAMSDVVNGPGTAGRARLPLDNVKLAGKTGTAQVVSLSRGDGKNTIWKYRDHGLFIAFAPFDNPRYACATVIEHGGGSGAAYPVARDVLLYLYDRQKAMDSLLALEKQWGGDIEQRMARDLALFRARQSGEAQSDTKDGEQTT
ncbi:penicillin-binding protein 2 [Novosphingopyxis iocasae]|uniref:penicillin-binding protein 2 n=1 Tax=Novosphingopyxis iocasae TaxID=2762729 RepID=UPI00165168F4